MKSITLVYSALVGSMLGLIWAFSLNIAKGKTLLLASLAGLLIGHIADQVVMNLIAKGKLKGGHSFEFVGTFLGIVMILGTISAGIFGLIKTFYL